MVPIKYRNIDTLNVLKGYYIYGYNPCFPVKMHSSFLFQSMLTAFRVIRIEGVCSSNITNKLFG